MLAALLLQLLLDEATVAVSSLAVSSSTPTTTCARQMCSKSTNTLVTLGDVVCTRRNVVLTSTTHGTRPSVGLQKTNPRATNEAAGVSRRAWRISSAARARKKARWCVWNFIGPVCADDTVSNVSSSASGESETAASGTSFVTTMSFALSVLTPWRDT